jgi:LytR cell envelope-related transcriptional attenuator
MKSNTARIGRGAFVAMLLIGTSACEPMLDRFESLAVRPIPLPAGALVLANEGYYRDAVRAINARDYGRALDYLQAAREKQPDDVRVLNAFGVVYDKLGRFDLSARYYTQARTLDPLSAVVLKNLAYSEELQGIVSGKPAPPTITMAKPPAAVVPLLVVSQPAPSATVAETPVVVISPVVVFQPAPSVTVAETPAVVVPPVVVVQPVPAVTVAETPAVVVPPVVVQPVPAVTVAETPSVVVPPVAVAQPEPAIAATEILAAVAPPVIIAQPAPTITMAEPPAAIVSPVVLAQPAPQASDVVREEPAVLPEIAPSETPALPVVTALSTVNVQSPNWRPLVVINAAGQQNVAEPVLERLLGLGWSASRPVAEEETAQSVTTVYYSPTFISAARGLARSLPYPVRVAACDDGCRGLRLVVGADYLVGKPSLQQPVPVRGKVPTLTVVNASGKDDAAKAIGQRLLNLGWSAPGLSAVDTPNQPFTTVYYSEPRIADARGLARTLPYPVRLTACSDGCDGLQLIVGADYLGWETRHRKTVAVR